MGKFRDLTGQTFGKLKVIKLESKRFHPNSIGCEFMWECLCSCGKTKIIGGTPIKAGKTLSCGCYNLEIARLPKGEAQLNNLFSIYKHNAKKSKRKFDLSKEEFIELVGGNCYYCSSKPNTIKKSYDRTISDSWKKESIFLYNGIDRTNNDEGYEKSNTVTACIRCNKSKGTQNKEEFLNMVKVIYERHFT